MSQKQTYRDKKVIKIGIVRELTGLTERRIRYYENRNLIFPERTASGSRTYSFSDIEKLMAIAEKMEEGAQTDEIRRDFQKKENISAII